MQVKEALQWIAMERRSRARKRR